MGENNWLLVKFRVKDPKRAPALRGLLYLITEVGMAENRKIDCPNCKASLDFDCEPNENIWFDTGEEVLLVPREMLKYLEDSQGIIGMT